MRTHENFLDHVCTAQDPMTALLIWHTSASEPRLCQATCVAEHRAWHHSRTESWMHCTARLQRHAKTCKDMQRSSTMEAFAKNSMEALPSSLNPPALSTAELLNIA